MKAIILLLLVLMFQAQESPTNHRENNHRTGVFEGTAIREYPRVKWQVEFESNNVGTPLILDDDLYITAATGRNQTALFALNTETGETRWSIELNFAVVGGLAYAENSVLMGTPRGFVALDAENGEEKWRAAPGELIGATPLVVEDRVYITGQRNVYALDTQTGDELWTFSGCNWTGYTTYEADIFYFPCEDTIHAVDALTGEEQWSLQIPDAQIFGLALDDDTLFTGGSTVYAVDIETQKILWEGQSGEYLSPPVVSDTLIYSGGMDNFMYAMDRETGEGVWQFDAGDWALNDVIMVEDVLYFGVGNHMGENPGERNIYALDGATGDILWTFTDDGMWISAPTFADDTLYVVNESGTLFALVSE